MINDRSAQCGKQRTEQGICDSEGHTCTTYFIDPCSTVPPPTPTPTPTPCPTPHDKTQPNLSCYRFGPQCAQSWRCKDRDGDGLIESGRELFGSYTWQPRSPARNGFLALAEYDKQPNGGNGDGMIDKKDSVFSRLRLWQDTNHNGVSEAGELHTTVELGLVAFDLKYKESKRTDEYGNQFKYRAKVADARGAMAGRWAWDVFLVGAQ